MASAAISTQVSRRETRTQLRLTLESHAHAKQTSRGEVLTMVLRRYIATVLFCFYSSAEACERQRLAKRPSGLALSFSGLSNSIRQPLSRQST